MVHSSTPLDLAKKTKMSRRNEKTVKNELGGWEGVNSRCGEIFWWWRELGGVKSCGRGSSVVARGPWE